MGLNWIDWLVIGLYIVGMIGLSIFLARGQKTGKDYYLGGNTIGYFPIAISTMATQCSTNSILGAPAFVAFSLGGGLLWLQYEIAVPFAMIFIMIFFLPFYRKVNLVSIYEYLELRFGPGTRTVLSVIFQFLRAFSTGVTVYGISWVLSTCLNVPFWVSVVLLGVVTVIYDSIGGMKAVIYSDLIQMIILYGVIIIGIVFAVNLVGGIPETLAAVDPERLKAIDFKHFGLGDGKDFAFWPMFIGGIFLYISYYGCDQTQVQRELSSKDIDDAKKSLFVNGILRFPVVLTYCFLGIALAAFVAKNAEFVNILPTRESIVDGVKQMVPNFNMAVPYFVIKYFPHGVIGLVMVGLFGAAMSSLDSTINSLSATSVEDIIKRFWKKNMTTKEELWASKLTTVFWGALCTIFAFYVGDISDSIIISINKIGSLINGPILATFTLAILTRRTTGHGAVSGIILGLAGNALLWIYAPNISWLWWNVIGFFVTLVVAMVVSRFFEAPSYEKISELVWKKGDLKHETQSKVKWWRYYVALVAWGVMMIAFLAWI